MSCSESCQDNFFSEVYLLLLTQSLVRLSWTPRTQRNVTNHPKYRQIINCDLTRLIVFLFSLFRLRITTQLRSGAVDKMAGMFTKRIWQPYICQPNELKQEIRKKTGGGQTGSQAKIWGSHGPPRPSLRIATALEPKFSWLK